MFDKDKPIAIIGGGPMGLAAGYQLAKDGYTPVIFESDDRLGGMSASFDFGSTMIERYYHFHATTDYDLFKIMAELGIADKICWRETKMGYWYNGKLHEWGNPLALLRFKELGLISKLRYGFNLFLSSRRKDWGKLDMLSATRWLRDSIGDEAYDLLWDKLMRLKFYEYADEVSAAWIWSRIHRIGRSRYNIMQEKLGYIEGGSEFLINTMRDMILKSEGKIYLGNGVKKVVIEGGRLIGVESRNGFFNFDKVISTVPLPYIPSMIPDLPLDELDKYKRLKNIGVVCLIAKLKKSVTGNFWLNINDDSMDIPGMIEYSNLRPLDFKVVYIPFYLPASHPMFGDSDDIFISKSIRYMMKINCSLSESDFLDIKVNRYRYAQPISTVCYLSSIPSRRSSVSGLLISDSSHYYPYDRGVSESIGWGRKLAKESVSVG